MKGHFCRIIPRLTGPIMLVSVVLTVAGGYLTSKLSLDSDFAALLPNTFPSVQALEEMEAEVGGAVSKLRVVFTSSDFPAMLRLADDLEGALDGNDYVLYVQYQNEVDFYREHALLFLDPAELDSLYTAVQRAIDREKQAVNPFIVDDLFGSPSADEKDSADEMAEWEARYSDAEPNPYFTNPDSTVLVVEVAAAQEGADLEFATEMFREIRGVVESLEPGSYAPDMEVLYGGNIKNRIDEFEALRGDIFQTASYGIGAVFLLLTLYLRSLVAPVLIALSLLASLAWTFGFTYLVVGQLNTITGFLFVVLFGMGIDYGIHAFARYRESREAGQTREQGLHKMACETGRALLTTTLTTSAAFFSLLLMDFRGFSELGLITGVGLIFALIAMIFLLPALIVVSERVGLLRIKAVPGKALAFEPRPVPGVRPVLWVVAALTLLGGAAFSRVGFQYDFTDLRFITPERERVGELTRDVFSRSESPALILADSPEQAEEVVERIRSEMARDTVTPTVDAVRSIFSLVPTNQPAKLERIRELRRLIEEEHARDFLEGDDLRRLERLDGYLEVDEPVTLADVPENELRPFLTRSGEVGSFVFIYPDVPLRNARNAIDFAEDIGTVRLESGAVLHAASPNLVLADLVRMVIREGKLAVLLSFGTVFLIVLADIRDVREALLVVSPLVLGLTWMGGIMFLLGMKLNLFNMVVLPSVIGIGVDSAVHLRYRYRVEGPGSLPFVLRRTGPAVAMATVTTIVGYTGLIMAHHPGLNSIGSLAVIGLSTALVAALVALPALMEASKPG